MLCKFAYLFLFYCALKRFKATSLCKANPKNTKSKIDVSECCAIVLLTSCLLVCFTVLKATIFIGFSLLMSISFLDLFEVPLF